MSELEVCAGRSLCKAQWNQVGDASSLITMIPSNFVRVDISKQEESRQSAYYVSH